MKGMAAVLQLENVSVKYPVSRAAFTTDGRKYLLAVDTVSLEVSSGETLGLVGESGCGKSTLARAAMRLTDVSRGAIRIDGEEITHVPLHRMRRFRSAVQMIFQDPHASLNPRMTVYDTLAEPLRLHRGLAAKDCAAEVARLMDDVGLASRLVRKYPHEFSGGQRQRIAIARCLAVRPKCIIADEPVSALDVSIQAQILNLLSDLSRRRSLAMLFISHDLSVVRHLSHRIAVMNRGKIVEQGDAAEVFERPKQEYTRTLMKASEGHGRSWMKNT
jgi:ABC-type glutathione transport system ATPase component